jgi:plastocyanin
MKPIRYLGVALLFVLGCQGTPTVTRTGDVKDIIIGDNLSSGEVVVSPGDEVRWVNKRTAPVRVIFLDQGADKQLSCKNNFGGLMTPSNTAKLAMNETASACFRDPGYFRYTVRMESANVTGERNVSGVVKVGQASQDAGRMSDQNSGQTREQTSDQNSGKTTDRTGGPPSSMSTTTTTTTTTMPPQ